MEQKRKRTQGQWCGDCGGLGGVEMEEGIRGINNGNGKKSDKKCPGVG